MVTTETAEIEAVGISLPDYWIALPVRRADFDNTVGGLRRRWREAGMSRIDQRRCELMLQRVRHQLSDGGVQFAGAAFELGLRDGVEDTPENTEALVAVCVFSVITAAELQTDVRLSIPVLYSAFSKRGPDNDVARITDLEPPEVCTLPAGRAVRLRRLYERDEVTSRLERWFAETYVLPIGTSGDAAGVLQFCTTNVGLAAEFSGQFARYAETFTLFGPEDPTEMNTPPEDD